MTAPSFVAAYDSSWTVATTPRTRANVVVAVGDLVVVKGATKNSNSLLATPTGGAGFTWTLHQSYTGVAADPGVWVWSAVATVAQTFTVSIVRSGTSARWGFTVEVWSSASGVGASSSTTAMGAPALGITTTAADSAISVVVSDTLFVSGASRVWRSVNGAPATEETYFTDGSIYTVYAGYHPNAGAAGSKTVGLSAPTGQDYSIAALEILGSAGGTVHEAAGHVAATSTSTAAATALLVGAGSTTGISTTAGASTARLGSAGAAPAITGTSGAAEARYATAGAVAAVSGTSGAAELVTTTPPVDAAGVVSAVSGTSGAASVVYGSAGATAVTSSSTAAATARAGAAGATLTISTLAGAAGARLAATGVVDALADVAGSSVAMLVAAGTADAVSGAAGAAATVGDLHIPILSAGPPQTSVRHTAGAPHPSRHTVGSPAGVRRLTAGPSRPPRYATGGTP